MPAVGVGPHPGDTRDVSYQRPFAIWKNKNVVEWGKNERESEHKT